MVGFLCTWWLLAQTQASFSPFLARPKWSPVKVSLSIEIIISIYHLPSSDDLHIIAGRTPGSHIRSLSNPQFHPMAAVLPKERFEILNLVHLQSRSLCRQFHIHHTVVTLSRQESFEDCMESVSSPARRHIQMVHQNNHVVLFFIFLTWMAHEF